MTGHWNDCGAVTEYLKVDTDFVWVVPDGTVSHEEATTMGCGLRSREGYGLLHRHSNNEAHYQGRKLRFYKCVGACWSLGPWAKWLMLLQNGRHTKAVAKLTVSNVLISSLSYILPHIVNAYAWPALKTAPTTILTPPISQPSISNNGKTNIASGSRKSALQSQSSKLPIIETPPLSPLTQLEDKDPEEGDGLTVEPTALGDESGKSEDDEDVEVDPALTPTMSHKDTDFPGSTKRRDGAQDDKHVDSVASPIRDQDDLDTEDDETSDSDTDAEGDDSDSNNEQPGAAGSQTRKCRDLEANDRGKEVAKIPKSKGTGGRDYNICIRMGLADDKGLFAEIRTNIHVHVDKILNHTKCLHHNNDMKLAVIETLRYPQLELFVHHWPIKSLVTVYLKNTSGMH
ncbi:hypothetical protein K439DRAFT_1617141 [Ramaria rubella]|nr:hypothetical protein K439DRAFT_1617141 [Ramaria rubella]